MHGGRNSPVTAVHNQFLRRILGIRRDPDGANPISNADLYEKTGACSLTTHLDHLHLGRLGHLARLPDSSMIMQLLFATGIQGGAGVELRAGALGVQWAGMAVAALETHGVLGEWYTLAQDQAAWKDLCEQVRHPTSDN